MSYALKRRAIPPARDPANRGTLEAMATAVNELSGTIGPGVDRAVRVGELVEAGVMQLNTAGLLERKDVALADAGPIEIADVDGLQAALDGKASISGQSFTGLISAPGISTNGAGIGYVQMVPGSATNPGYLAFFTPDNTRRAYLGWASGNNIQFQSENGWGVEFSQAPKVAGNAVWHAGSFDPATKLNANNPSATGDLTVAGRILSNGAHFNSTAAAAVLSAAGGTVYLRPNGADNSTGEATLTTAGNFTAPGYIFAGGDMRAAALYPTNNNGAYMSGNGGGIQHNGNWYHNGPFYRLSANSASWVAQPRLFIGPTDPGPLAADGDVWIQT